jgi:4-hydroxy-2-oxoheptanedioate aldolase
MTGKPTLRQLWDSGGATLGGWCSIPNSFTAEIMGLSFDWVCIDMQHGLTGQDTMIGMLQSLAITGTPAFVRVPWNNPGEIMRALDAGAQGVIVPMINSAAEARAAVGACRYPPAGYRSWGPSRNALYSSRLVPAEIDKQIICAVMVETSEGVEALEEILAVPGVDAVFIGPSDLAVSIGVEPARASEDRGHEELVRLILRGCQRHDVVAGIFAGGAEAAVRWRDSGARMLALQTDARMLRAACENLTQAVRDKPIAASPDSAPSYV